MAYPPPPGISSLPNRPPSPASDPAASSSFRSPATSSNPWSPPPRQQPSRPVFNGSNGNNNNTNNDNNHNNNNARSSYGAPPASYNAPSRYQVSAPPASYGAPPTFDAAARPYRGPGTPTAPAAGGGAGMPHMRNPFPVPGALGAAANDYDPGMAAAIATWQSAYMPRGPGAAPDRNGLQRANAGPYPLDGYPESPALGGDDAAAAAAAAGETADQAKKQTVAREGGGKKWTDDSLLEWDPAHLRIFVGNLGGETTDNSLLTAFSRWSSVQKARVIRDKRTNKSKGYGFVSFSDADDFFSAAKEMNGKYIGSHPVVIRKANTEIKVVKAKDRDGRHNNHNNRGRNNRDRNRQRNDEKAAAAAEEAYEPNLGPINPGRVTKSSQKTKNGLRLLG